MIGLRSSDASLLFAAAGLLLLPARSGAQEHEDWSYNLAIYEVNVRQYTEAGTFAAFETHLDRLQDLGVGILWFMPVHPIGQENRLGTLGSYYSVRDYMDVNPEFGTLDDFKGLVQQIHDRGMYVLIDWVANHTAWDNNLTTEHPEWYVTDSQGNFIPPPGTNWSDVIELDYTEQGLRDYMIETMKFWIQEVDVDGFRCDAVSFVPMDFWQEAISEIKATEPDIFLLAEGDGRQWHDAGFDMTYGWGLYGFESGVLKRIADGVDTAADLYDYAVNEKAIYPEEAYRMHFTSNHDENSWHGTTAELFGDAAEVFAVFTATFNGMPLVYSGQEAGLDERLSFFDKDQITWRDHENADLYKTLIHLKKENRALWNGVSGGPLQRLATTSDTDIFAFVREMEDDKVLIALNLSDQEQTVTLTGASSTGLYEDVFTGEAAVLEEGASLTLPAWGFVVYEASTTDTGADFDASPDRFGLGQNHPNPFSYATTISYSLAEPSEARLTIFDLLGRKVKVVDSGSKQAGRYRIDLGATDLPSGVYVYRLEAGKNLETRRLIVLR